MIIAKLSDSLDDNKFWKEYMEFCKKLPKEKVNVEELLRLLPNVVKRLENDGASYQIYESVKDFVGNHICLGIELFEKIKKSDDVVLIGFLTCILKGLHSVFDRESIIKEIKLLIVFGTIHMKTQGYTAILNFEKGEFPKEFITYIQGEVEMISINPPHHMSVIVRLFAKFRKEIPNADETIIKLSQSNIPQVQYEIINVLNTEISFSEESDLFENLLFTLVSVKPEYGGIFQNFNYGLFYNRTAELGRLIANFLEEWLKYDVSRSKNILLFENTIVRLHNKDNSSFKFLITKWLNSDDKVLHRALEEILLNISLRKIKDIELCRDYLKTLNENDIEFIMSKIIGYIHFKEPIRSMLYSILTTKIDSPIIVDNISGIFCEYVIFNYPSTIDYLKEKMKMATRKEKLVISKIVKAGDKYYDDIRNLPIRNEFSPSEDRLKIYNEIHRQGFVKKQQESEENDTSFMSSIKRIQLRTGRGMFSKYKDVYTEKTEMQAINYNEELPRGEFIDPIGHLKIRRLNRTFKRI